MVGGREGGGELDRRDKTVMGARTGGSGNTGDNKEATDTGTREVH